MGELFVPLFAQILVKELDPPEIRKSGVLVPETARERNKPPQTAMVLAVGEGEDWWASVDFKMPVKVGDVVVYPHHAGTYIEVDEEKLLVLNVGQLLGIMVTDPAEAEALTRGRTAEP